MLDNSILTNIRNTFASAVQRIYIPSLGKTYSFREASVKEHKAMSKTIISNMDSQSVVYAATLAMIRNLCMEDDFDPYLMSEFDRLRIIVHMFSNNFFSRNLALKCPVKACGESIRYPVKHGTLLKMMDSVDCSDMVFNNDNHIGSVKVTYGFPSTKRYLSILEAVDLMRDSSAQKKGMLDGRQYDAMDNAFGGIESASAASASAEMDAINKIRKRREILKGNIKKVVDDKKDIMGNVDFKTIGSESIMLDMADIYMKRIEVTRIEGSENMFDIDMSDFSYDDTEQLMSALPMGLFIAPDGNNVVKHMTSSIFRKMNACVPTIKCPKCGYEISKRLTLQNFFIFG